MSNSKKQSKRVFREGDIVEGENGTICVRDGMTILNPDRKIWVGLSLSRIKEMEKRVYSIIIDFGGEDLEDLAEMVKEVFEGVE